MNNTRNGKSSEITVLLTTLQERIESMEDKVNLQKRTRPKNDWEIIGEEISNLLGLPTVDGVGSMYNCTSSDVFCLKARNTAFTIVGHGVIIFSRMVNKALDGIAEKRSSEDETLIFQELKAKDADGRTNYVKGAFNQAYACLLYFYAQKIERAFVSDQIALADKLSNELSQINKMIIMQRESRISGFFECIENIDSVSVGHLSVFRSRLQEIQGKGKETAFHESFCASFLKVPLILMKSDIQNCDMALCNMSDALKLKLGRLFPLLRVLRSEVNKESLPRLLMFRSRELTVDQTSASLFCTASGWESVYHFVRLWNL